MRTPRAFTLIELLVVITIIGILAAIALPNYIKAKDKAKEVQSKSNGHSIQVALERYQVDQEQYPLFLIGGDEEGWRYWHDRHDEANPDPTAPANRWLHDPLIFGGYLVAYATNPFVDNGSAVIQQTGPVTPGPNGYQAGDGDPRFGFRGTTIGNGLDHPMVYRQNPSGDGGSSESNIVETRRTLITSSGGDPLSKGFPDWEQAGSHYTMGGRRQKVTVNGQQQLNTVYTHWPGNFFYRGFPERFTVRKGWTIDEPNWYHHTEISRYMMGVYGSYATEGVDAIRLELTCPTCPEPSNGIGMRYQLPGPFGSYQFNLSWMPLEQRRGGMPEVAGGGNESEGPWLPYDQSKDYPGSFIYGSPDGVNDALVLILTAGEEVQAY